MSDETVNGILSIWFVLLYIIPGVVIVVLVINIVREVISGRPQNRELPENPQNVGQVPD